MSTPFLGKLGDRIGNHRLLFNGAIFIASFVFPFVVLLAQPLQLGILRLPMASVWVPLCLSVNSLLTKMTPKEGIQEYLALIKAFHTLDKF